MLIHRKPLESCSTYVRRVYTDATGANETAVVSRKTLAREKFSSVSTLFELTTTLPKNPERMATVKCTGRSARRGEESFPSVGNRKSTRGSGSRSRSSIATRKARRGRGALWIRQRISPTSTWDVRCNEFRPLSHPSSLLAGPRAPSSSLARSSGASVRGFESLTMRSKKKKKPSKGRLEDERKGRVNESKVG